MQLNAGGWRVVEEIITRRRDLDVESHTLASGARVVDCGVSAGGGVEAGVLMARAAMAGLAAVDVVAGGMEIWPDCPWPVVRVATDEPLAACLAAQYAGWKVTAKGYFAMASGPIRAAIGREDIYDVIGLRERPVRVVGILEAAKLPPDDVCRTLADEAGVSPEDLVLLVARTSSAAGTLQVIARSLETALHKLHDLRFDLHRIRRGFGQAPLAPTSDRDDLAAIGRTNDAILYGGHVVLEVAGDDASLVDIGPRMVSRASADYGAPFKTLFDRAGRDFYALDPALFAPAAVDLVNVDTGCRHRFGGIAQETVRESFRPAATTPSGSGA